MKEERIIIEIDPEGAITADADGFVGDACLGALARLLDGLGAGEPAVERKRDDQRARVRKARVQKTGRKA